MELTLSANQVVTQNILFDFTLLSHLWLIMYA